MAMPIISNKGESRDLIYFMKLFYVSRDGLFIVRTDDIVILSKGLSGMSEIVEADW